MALTDERLMKLIENVKEIWRFTSVQLAALATVLGSAYLVMIELPPEVTADIPHWFQRVLLLAFIMSAGGVIPARAIKQSKLPSRQKAAPGDSAAARAEPTTGDTK